MWSRTETDTFLQRTVLVLVLLLIWVAAIFFGGQRPSEFVVLVGLGITAAGVWLARLSLGERPKLFLHPVLGAMATFIAYAFWRTGTVAVPYLALAELLQLVLYAVVFLVVLHNLSDREESVWVMHALVALGACLSVYALVQGLNHSDSVLWLKQPTNYLKRAGATLVNPNHFAGLLVALLPLALGQAFISRQPGWIRVAHGYGATLMLVGLGVSMSRGGWVAGALVCFTFLVWVMARRPQLRLAAVGSLGIIVTAAVCFVYYNPKARARIEGVNIAGNVESGLRNYIWEPAWQEFLAFKTFGVGPAQFRVHFPQFRTPAMQGDPGWCHNEYLNLLCDYGLVGAGIVAVGLVIFGAGLLWSRKYAERRGSELGTRGSDRTALFVGTTFGLFGLALHSVGDFILHTPAVALVAVTLAALSASSVRHASERFRVNAPVLARALVAIALVGASIWMWPLALRRAREAVPLQRAAGEISLSPTLFADLNAAARIEPTNPRTAYELGENYRRLSFEGGPDWKTQCEAAIQWLERAQQLNPQDPFVHLKLGLAWHWLGEAEKSRRSFERAVDLGPNQVEIANTYAWNLLQQGRPRKARAILEQSLTWDPWGNWYARKCVIEIEQGKWPDRETNAPTRANL